MANAYCYLEITIPKAEEGRLRECADAEDAHLDPERFRVIDNGDGTALCEVDEAEDGWDGVLMRAAEQGLVFTGFRTCCGDSPPARFCGIDKIFWSVGLGDGDRPVVGVDLDTMTPLPDEMRYLRAFAERYKAVEAALKGVPKNESDA